MFIILKSVSPFLLLIEIVFMLVAIYYKVQIPATIIEVVNIQKTIDIFPSTEWQHEDSIDSNKGLID